MLNPMSITVFERMRRVLSLPIVLAFILASIAGNLFGYDAGLMSGSIITEDFVSRFFLDTVHYNAAVGIFVASVSCGAYCASLVTGVLSRSRIGYRQAIVMLCAYFFLGNTLGVTFFSRTSQLIYGRVVAGIAIGGFSVIFPKYFSDIVPRGFRYSITSTYNLSVALGYLCAYSTNFATSSLKGSSQWRIPVGMGYVCVVLLGVGVFYLPESPRRLLTLSGTDECINALRYIGGKQSDDSRAQAELRKLQAELKGRSLPLQRNLFGWLTGGAFYRLNLGIALQTFQQIIGANFFFYYGAFVFRSAGFTNLNPFVVQIVLGMVNVLCTLPGLYIIQNFGKRTPLIAGGLWQAAWMAVFAVVGRTGVDPDDKKASFALAFSACMFIAGYAMSWGPGVWIAVNEMHPLSTSTPFIALGSGMGWFANLFFTALSPALFKVNTVGFRIGYLFAGFNLAAALVVFYFYYESGGFSPEQVVQMYNDRTLKPWKSGSRFPAAVSDSDLELDKVDHKVEHVDYAGVV